MNSLSKNWLTDGLVDYEYKKYILLAYLQNIKKAFDFNEVYPHLNDLIFHYRNLLKIKENKSVYYESFPKSISHADFKKLEIVYKQIIEDDEVMKEIEEIVFFALPKLKELVEAGKEIYEFIEENIEIAPVGITPLYSDEGYLFLKPYQYSDTYIFRYKISIFEGSTERFQGINTELIETAVKGIGETYESKKLALIKQFNYLPNPATFLVVSKIACPMESTLLPISKRMLVQHINEMQA